MKRLLAWVIASITGVVLQFGIFLAAYQKLTFPFLHEEQRAENAPYIFAYVLPAILVATIGTMFMFHLLAKTKSRV